MSSLLVLVRKREGLLRENFQERREKLSRGNGILVDPRDFAAGSVDPKVSRFYP